MSEEESSDPPRIEGRRICITGGAGFIGSSLALRLAEHNEIVLFDNLHRNALPWTDLLDRERVTFLQGDVLDRAAVDAAVKDADIVVHLASIAGVDTVMRNPVKTMEVSLLGTYNVLESCRQHKGLERFVDFSTSEVFGRYAYKLTEGDVTALGAVGEARWTYAVSKLATEHLAHNYYKQYGVPSVAIRPFNIYGPRQVGQGAVHQFIVRALRDEDLTIHNDGSQIRSWCYIDDILDGLLMAIANPEAIGHVFNIGNPRSTVTIYNLAREVVRLAGSKSQLVPIRWDFADVELRIPNIDKAREVLGFEPSVDLEEGLTRTIAWYRETLESSP